VDDGSTDGTPDYLRALPGVTLLEDGTGPVAGINRALARVPPDADAVLLDPHIEVHQPDWLQRLQQAAYRAADIGIVGCRLRRPHGVWQPAGIHRPPAVYRGQRLGADEKDLNQYNADRDVDGVAFACVYLKRAVLAAAGLLDAGWAGAFAEADYCLRARERG